MKGWRSKLNVKDLLSGHNIFGNAKLENRRVKLTYFPDTNHWLILAKSLTEDNKVHKSKIVFSDEALYTLVLMYLKIKNNARGNTLDDLTALSQELGMYEIENKEGDV